jgi:hypothetical protein
MLRLRADVSARARVGKAREGAPERANRCTLAAPDRRGHITTVFQTGDVMAKNLMGWLPLLNKQDCCETVAFALREYGASGYANFKRGDLASLALVPHEDAIAALRCWARWTVWPQVRATLDILEGPPYTAPADQPD